MEATCHRYAVEGWGVGELWTAGRVVLAHTLLAMPHAVSSGAEQPRGGSASSPEVTLPEQSACGSDGFVAEVIQRVRRQLQGRQTAFTDVPLDLSWCTPFQAELARALRDVSWGEIVSYRDLAALAGRPRAARAAGSFCARNPFALLLPCHRVVAAGGIGGYGASGVALKRRLLALEGVYL